VILVDLWWNPALEDQAFDRAHRFGQVRDVNIFKLKIDGTVEDRILLVSLFHFLPSFVKSFVHILITFSRHCSCKRRSVLWQQQR
jgi:hypothetical protein